MRYFMLSAVVLCTAGTACAGTVGVQSGCTVQNTALRANCEMLQVLRCDGEEGPQRVDVYLGGKFLGEEEWAGVEMVRWRRGAMLQEMQGDFSALAALGAGESREVKAERSRRMTGSDAPAMVDAFDLKIEALGEDRRELASGQRRLVKRFGYSYASTAESGERVLEYDPALGLAIWGDAWDARVVREVYGPKHAAFMSDTAPEGAPCTPE
ncbi:hypothetical protein [Vannielia litorea]|uniref:hypothetical protein n=1 Tax=Vannielia litorea TaxID=1217970 RepID=UPI001BCDF821|nr:hypothetical protein [Vannielia litorea]